MTINIGRRYSPSPRWISDEIGEALAKVWARTAEWMRGIGADILHFGYNWSPLSFGTPEEALCGGQSVPTRHHMMLCGETNPKYIEVEFASLDLAQQRLLGANLYGKVLGQLILDRIRPVAESAIFKKSFGEPSVDSLGLSFPLLGDLIKTFRKPGFFAEFLKPCDQAIEELFADICETMTDMRFAELYKTLIKTERGICNPAQKPEEQALCLNERDVSFLRRTPQLAGSESEVAAILKAKGYPDGLMKALWPAVSARCAMRDGEEVSEKMLDWWRKGFAYSLYLMQEDGSGELRIAPFVYCGTCGMVEATQILLRRTTDPGDPEVAAAMSKALRDLSRHIGSSPKRPNRRKQS